MKILQAEFLKSAAKPTDWPKSDIPEIAFCGRSNVGKSTLLNHFLARKGMARVSRTPGRTRLLNFFDIRARIERMDGQNYQPVHFCLVDLPGFGYAKVSKEEQGTWRPQIEAYFTKRTHLLGVVLLFDCRRVAVMKEEPEILQEEEDLFFYLTSLHKQVLPVITKTDQLAKHERRPALDRLRLQLGIKPILFSSLAGEGVDDLNSGLEQILVSKQTLDHDFPSD